MAVKVIDPGPDRSIVKEALCMGCGAKLEYVPNDVKEKSCSDYDGGTYTHRWIDCPQCSKQVTVK